jgi:hypothetical protein
MTTTETIETGPPTVAELEAPEAPKRGRGRPRKAKPSGAGDTKPKPPAAEAGRGPGRPRAIDKLGDQLSAQFVALAAIVMMVNPTVGLILMEDAPAHGAALAKLADSNARVRKLLEGGVTGSAWLGVAVAFGTTAYKVNVALKVEQLPEGAAPAGDPMAAAFAGLGINLSGGAGA